MRKNAYAFCLIKWDMDIVKRNTEKDPRIWIVMLLQTAPYVVVKESKMKKVPQQNGLQQKI